MNASKYTFLRSQRTTRRRYLRWYQAKQRSCWYLGTEILIGLPLFFLVFQTRSGIWGRMPRLRRAARFYEWIVTFISSQYLKFLTWSTPFQSSKFYFVSCRGNTSSLSLPLAGVVELASGIPLPTVTCVNKNTFTLATISNFLTSSQQAGKKSHQQLQNPSW